jgi:HlyD family secretion protein
MTATTEGKTIEWYSAVPRSIKAQTIIGVVLVTTVFGGFSLWAATAPLAAAVIAAGSFVASGENKIIQHLEGGIIGAILVREGARVEEGQDLVKLDETAARANARQLTLRGLRLEATLARLRARATGLDSYTSPDSVLEAIADPEVQAIDESQRKNFESSAAKLANDIDVLQQNISALEFERDGNADQIRSFERQRTLLNEQLESLSSLLSQQLATRSAVSAVERALAEADGAIAELRSEMEADDAQIARFERQIIQLRDAARQSAFDEMQSVEAELDAIREQTRQAQDILGRTVIKAPVAGTVVRLYYHTPGGVIETGKAIMEILPSDVPLIIEAQVSRMQIDEVREGETASIRLTSLNQRTTPILTGAVDYVSADSVVNAAGAATDEIYVARVSVPPEQIRRVRGFTPTPGMPAEILIQTHERTFLEYLVKPIEDSMSRAFREQ